MTKIEGAEKGKGSVEDGIEFIKSFSKLKILPSRCKEYTYLEGKDEIPDYFKYFPQQDDCK